MTRHPRFEKCIGIAVEMDAVPGGVSCAAGTANAAVHDCIVSYVSTARWLLSPSRSELQLGRAPGALPCGSCGGLRRAHCALGGVLEPLTFSLAAARCLCSSLDPNAMPLPGLVQEVQCVHSVALRCHCILR